MKFQIKKFNKLTVEQLYKILKLRFDVFIKEQNSIYNEMDNEDLNSIHFFFEENNHIIAYLRINKKSKEISTISRLVVNKNSRKMGLGNKLTEKAIDYIKSKWKSKKIKIEAQNYLQRFYENYGFKRTSDVYLDGGVPHIHMILNL